MWVRIATEGGHLPYWPPASLTSPSPGHRGLLGLGELGANDAAVDFWNESEQGVVSVGRLRFAHG